MTPTQTAPAPPALADLVLVRMILSSNTPKKIRDDVGTVSDSGLSEGTFDEVREGLTAAGLLAKGKRNKFTVTDAGREEALRILGASELPPKTNWSTVLAKYLLPKATGLPPDRAATQLKSADNLAAQVLQKKYDLNRGAGNSVDKAMEAIVCSKLGYPGATTLTGLLEAVLSELVESDKPLTRRELKVQLPLFQTGLTGSKLKLDDLRRLLVRDWLGQQEPEPAQEPEEFDLPAFASTVRTLARTSPPADRFHDNKVFISAVWESSQREPNFPRLSRDEFKQRLLEANAANLLHLSRADLVQAMDPKLVAESETAYLNATFHFILLEGGAA